MANTPNQTSFDADNQPANRGAAGKGRVKGTQNKYTKTIKEMVSEALNGAHPEGGVAYLIEQAGKNPVAFMGLVGRLMPLQLHGAGEDGEHLHSLTVKFVRPRS